MAYIYRYKLRNHTLRDKINLTKWENEILSTIEQCFDLNLKDSFVENKCFEFSLYATTSTKSLQDLGRKLKVKLPLNAENYGFVREKQTLLAILYPLNESDNNDIHIEFIEGKIFENSDLFMQRAKIFINKHNLRINENYRDTNDSLVCNYFVDVVEAFVPKEKAEMFFGKLTEVKCYRIEAFHRRYSEDKANEKIMSRNTYKIEKCYDVTQSQHPQNILSKIKNKIDFLEIFKIEENSEAFSFIQNKLKIVLDEAQNFEVLKKLEKNQGNALKKYTLTVHNAGQAQAVSLTEGNKEETPFLYFDYGMPYGPNAHTTPISATLNTNSKSTIILSHIHKDHWFGVAHNFDALKCKWLIPDQPKSVQFRSVISAIIIAGGTVQVINKNFCSARGGITCASASTASQHLHKSGLALRLMAKDENGNALNILIPGDLEYDYIENSQLESLDLLVASHHGGKYTESNNSKVPFPRAGPHSTVIYSYGINNSFNHPSKVDDYKAAGWRIEKNTASDKYFITFSF